VLGDSGGTIAFVIMWSQSADYSSLMV